MSTELYKGHDATKTKIYGVIKDAHYIPDKEQATALAYLKLIVKSPHVGFCDSYDLRSCFSWHSATQINAGNYYFWDKINEYLNRQRER